MGIINVAAQDGLRAWGTQLSHVAAQLPRPEVPYAKLGVNEALERMGSTHADIVRTSGWEMSNLLAPRNDNLCGEKALLDVLSTTQRAHGGDMAAAMRNLALTDGRTGAVLTAFDPRGVKARDGGAFRSHSVALFRDQEGRGLVFDPLTATAPDGILSVEDWLRIVDADADKLIVTSALDSIPTRGSIGGVGAHFTSHPIPPHAWEGVTAPLIDSWEALAHDHRRPG